MADHGVLAPPPPVPPAPADGLPDGREAAAGAVGVWAIVGVLAVALAAQTWMRWVTSPTEFSPAPILGPDDYPLWREVVLRVEEGLSFLEMAALLTFVVVLPLRRYGRLGLDTKIAAGCLMAPTVTRWHRFRPT